MDNAEHLVSLFINATEGFVVTGPSGDIVLVNSSACRMFGYSDHELIGQKIELLIPHEYRKVHVHHRNDFYKDPQTRVMGHGRDLHGQKKNGEKFPVEVSLSSYLLNGDRFVTGFIVDITLRKAIENDIVRQKSELEKLTGELQSLNRQLEGKVEERTTVLKEALGRLEESQHELSEALDKEKQLNEIKSRFVSMASHEFRTPLSTVLSSASLLAKYTTAEDQQKRERHIEKIKGSVKHLNDLLEDFLSLGKLDEGKIGATYSEFNMKNLISETVEEMKGIMKSGQQIISRHNGDEVVVSDGKMLKNILINLINNAIKFSDPGKSIYVETDVNSDIKIKVKDEGIGIPDEEKEHLFESFFRARNAQNIQGTGLGLHIVKRYADLLNGTIDLKSTIDEGTAVTISIPIKN
jgi:PAS domain S-box-containing protein